MKFRHALSCLALALAPFALPAFAQQPVLEEVPFVTSPDNVTLEMLRIANVGPTDHVIDLGSGDGRIVILAARRFGASGLGVEIDPALVERSIRNARDAGVSTRAEFRVQDLFKTDLSAATVVTMYLLTEVNLALRPTILKLKPGTRIVSHDWDMGDWKPDQTTEVPVPDKKVGLAKSSKIHFWTVPANIDGLWCGVGMLRGGSLQVAQRFQEFSGTLRWRNRARDVAGRLQGAKMQMTGGRHQMALEAVGDELHVLDGQGDMALGRGQRFRRANGPACEGAVR
ncbi:SAM-dependent methyltransferase [Ramlibacter sp.]|uniref:SAM-dependent methyltransferase n=1 Tax=Ramlibacter sp. TaxID=1917967 RepID=UPI003D1392BF